MGKSTLWSMLAVVAVSPWLAGCGCRPGTMKRFDVVVTLDKSVRDAQGVLQTVEVDLVAVNAANLPTWQNQSMGEYFTPGSPTRSSADRHTFRLGQGHETEKLSKDDKIWDVWDKQHAMNLLVLSSFPPADQVKQEAPGDSDPRRRTLPLDCARWDKGQNEIRVSVTGGGLRVDTPPLPPEE